MTDATAGAPDNIAAPGPDRPLPEAVQALLAQDRAGDVIHAELLSGGHSNFTRRLYTASGRTYVTKVHDPVIPGLFAGEAEGLRALALPGCPRVVRVLAVADEVLVLEDLGSGHTQRSTFWEELGRGVACLHNHTSPRFGWATGNYLGLEYQHNGWLADGYEFFTVRRVLPCLSLPRCEQELTADDRRAVEGLCARLPELIPTQPASLLHGDLIAGNVLAGPEGEPVLIDPAVHYGWAEAELALTPLDDPFPEEFYRAYTERRPPLPGWRERFEIYLLREHLYMLAQVGNRFGHLQRLRHLTAKYG